MSECHDKEPNNSAKYMFHAVNDVPPPPGTPTLGQHIRALEDRALAAGPIPKMYDEVQESLSDLLATEPFRRPGESVKSIVARSGLYNEFRVWPRERIQAHIAEVERQAREQAVTEPKLIEPNCI